MADALRAIYGLWVAWAFSWLVAGAWSAPTVIRVPLAAAAPYRAFQVVGAILLFYRTGWASLPASWPVAEPLQWAMAALVAAGFGFCWWARLHLGRLWSGTVERKEGHRIVDSGPYRLVRHPIYTGLIVAGYATACARGSAIALAGASVMVAAWYVKSRLEEGLLRAELGLDAYAAYARRTPMLVPFPKL